MINKRGTKFKRPNQALTRSHLPQGTVVLGKGFLPTDSAVAINLHISKITTMQYKFDPSI